MGSISFFIRGGDQLLHYPGNEEPNIPHLLGLTPELMLDQDNL
jgi:hypothetical protein